MLSSLSPVSMVTFTQSELSVLSVRILLHWNIIQSSVMQSTKTLFSSHHGKSNKCNNAAKYRHLSKNIAKVHSHIIEIWRMKITEVVERLQLTPFSFISLLSALSLTSKSGTAQCIMSSTTKAMEVFLFSIPLALKCSIQFN